MKNNNKWLLGGLIAFAVILLATAIVLFFRLKQPVPTASPKPKPAASPQLPPIQETTPEEICSLSFTVSASPSPGVSPSPSPSVSPSPSASPSPSPSVSPSPSASPSPSPSPEPSACFDTCGSDADCEDDLRCMSVSGTKRCVNPACSEDADCVCASAQPSASPQAQASPVIIIAQASPPPRAEQPALPQAGVNTPMVLGVSAGIIMMLVGWLGL